MKYIALFAAVAVTLLAAGCNDGSGQSTGAQKETAATNQLLNQAATVVGVPGIINFTEKRQLKMLYELRDQADLVTYSYYVDIQGRLHKVCPSTSVGFGMPFSAQFTAPQVPVEVSTMGQGANPSGQKFQPEPNGLYMPDSTSATWVICLGEDGDLDPVYVEPQIIVSLTPMESVN